MSLTETSFKPSNQTLFDLLVTTVEQGLSDVEEPRVWEPLAGPQYEAYSTPAFETLYGGAAGGGKSDLLLGLARHEHYKVLLVRRTYPDLERSLIVRSQEFYGDPRKYNAGKHVWKIDGRRIEFGHLEHDKSVFQYQSAQYDLIGFDELTQFTLNQYVYMFSRARKRKSSQAKRVRIVACTNPGGEGNDWVMERWAAWLDENHPNPAKPGELRYYKRLPDGNEIEVPPDDPKGVSRTFIPAKLSDNPYLDEEYVKTLDLLPEPHRSQLLYGDWKAGLTDDAYQVIPRAWVKLAQARYKPVPPELKMTSVGADIARGGDDKTVFAPLYGNHFDKLQKYPGRLTPDGPSVIALLRPLLAFNPGAVANIDVIGVGAAVYDMGRNDHLPVFPVNFANKSEVLDKSGKLKMRNKRAECWWKFREALDPQSGLNIALPPDSELLADLCAPRWSYGSSGLTIEDKEEIKDRIGRSPDCGDAVVIAFYKASTAADWLAALNSEVPPETTATTMPPGGSWGGLPARQL